MSTKTSVLVLALVISSASVARADEHASSNAEALFREGRHAADVGNYAVACEKFEASHKLEPAPGTLLNLADCEEARGELTRAWRDFLALADALPEADERKTVALERARNLERSMPRLRVRLARTSETAHVFRDGVELGEMTLGVALPVDPGRHFVIVREGGYHEQAYTVYIRRGEERDLQVEHGFAKPDPKRAVGFTVGGLGVASLVAGTVTGVFALTSLSASNAQCPNGVCSSQDGLARHDQARSFAIATDVLLGVGAALVVTSIILLVSSHGHPQKAPSLALARF
jgi:hypothetical protein